MPAVIWGSFAWSGGGDGALLLRRPRYEGSLRAHGVGDYRVLYEIQDAELIVLVVKIGHRREVYR